MKRRPTIQDVARTTSLSISTVSLVLNDKPNVSEETRRRVRRAIQELGYHPHRGARGLASKLSGNIGFIVSEDHFTQAEPFYTRIFLGTELEARDHDYYVLLTTIGKRSSKDKPRVPRFLLERNVDGVIVAGRVDEAFIEHIVKLGLPFVLVDYGHRSRRLSSILIDNRGGVRAAMLHLISGGYKKIGFIAGDLAHPSIEERYDAYRKMLTESGIAYRPALVITDEKSTRIDDGYHAMERMMKAGGAPRAVLAANDAMAIGAIQYLKGAGRRVPEDVAVVGFDDVEMSSHTEPRLTTVRVPKEEMGKLAARRLVEIIKTPTGTVTTVHVPVELVVRESCGVSRTSDPDSRKTASVMALSA